MAEYSNAQTRVPAESLHRQVAAVYISDGSKPALTTVSRRMTGASRSSSSAIEIVQFERAEQVCVCQVLAQREHRAILGGGHVEEFFGTFVVARDAGTDSEVGAAIDEELSDFGVHALEMGQGMEHRRLTTDAARVNVGTGVDVRTAVEEEAGGVEEAVFGGNVEEGCASKSEQAPAGLTAIQLGVAAVVERRVDIEEGGEFVGAVAEDREYAGNVVARVGSGAQKHLDAGSELLGVARVGLNGVVEGGPRISWVAAIGVSAVIEEPLERFRFEILTRCEENREPAESVDVGSVMYQKFHHRNAARLGNSHQRRVVDQDLAKFRVRGQEFLDAGEVVAGNRLLKLADFFDRLDMLFELGPALEAVLSGD